MITIAETQEYFGKIRKLVDNEEQRAIIDYLSMHPKSGDVIRETGGIRKLRWGRNSKGKRGGIRIIYYYYNDRMPLYLLTTFTKGEKEDISKAERHDLAKLTHILKTIWLGEKQ